MPQALPPPLLRPAVVEIRYKDSGQFRKAVALYRKLLRKPETMQEESVNIQTFKIGYTERADRRDMLLRLTYPLGKLDTISSHTVLYWKVEGQGLDQLNTLHTALQGQGMTSVEKPPGSSQTAHPAARSVLKDKETGTLLGLTINPPVPTATMSDPENGNSSNFLEQIWARLGVFGSLLLTVVGIGGGAVAFHFGKRKGRAIEQRLQAANSAARPPADAA